MNRTRCISLSVLAIELHTAVASGGDPVAKPTPAKPAPARSMVSASVQQGSGFIQAELVPGPQPRLLDQGTLDVCPCIGVGHREEGPDKVAVVSEDLFVKVEDAHDYSLVFASRAAIWRFKASRRRRISRRAAGLTV